MNPNPKFAGVVLAAGEATRMGVAKPALPYGSSTMVGSVLATAHAAGLDPIIVVTGFHSSQVIEAVGGLADIAHNENPEMGNMSSLLVGIDAAGDADGVVVLLSDMPDVQSEVVSNVVRGVARSGARCGWANYPDGRGHPVALARSVFGEVRMLSGTKALWPFFSGLPDSDVFALTVDSPRPIDVNTQADYERATTPRNQ